MIETLLLIGLIALLLDRLTARQQRPRGWFVQSHRLIQVRKR